MTIIKKLFYISLILIAVIFLSYYLIRPTYNFPSEWNSILICTNKDEISKISKNWDENSAGKYVDMYYIKGFSTWSKGVQDGYVQLLVNCDESGKIKNIYMNYMGYKTGLFNRRFKIK